MLKKKSIIITDKSIKEFKNLYNISKRKKFILKSILGKKSTVELVNHSYEGEKQNIKIKYKNKNYKFSLNLSGKHNLKMFSCQF